MGEKIQLKSPAEFQKYKFIPTLLDVIAIDWDCNMQNAQ